MKGMVTQYNVESHQEPYGDHGDPYGGGPELSVYTLLLSISVCVCLCL